MTGFSHDPHATPNSDMQALVAISIWVCYEGGHAWFAENTYGSDGLVYVEDTCRSNQITQTAFTPHVS